jgi:hypothetical protein
MFFLSVNPFLACFRIIEDPGNSKNIGKSEKRQKRSSKPYNLGVSDTFYSFLDLGCRNPQKLVEVNLRNGISFLAY